MNTKAINDTYTNPDYINLDIKPQVIIVDDNSDQLIVYKFFLSNLTKEFEFVTYNSPNKAFLDIISQKKSGTLNIYLIISDFYMYPENGIDFFKKLTKAKISIPFILISAFLSEGIINDAKSLGIKNCINKNLEIRSTMIELYKQLENLAKVYH